MARKPLTEEQRERKRELNRRYRSRPEVREKDRERKQRPEYREKDRAYRSRPEVREKHIEHQRERRKRPEVREKKRENERARSARHDYGIVLDEKRLIEHMQGGGCAICGARRSRGGEYDLAIDHDHSLQGRASVRGVLCDLCNRVIGLLGDTAESVRAWAEKAIRYFERVPDVQKILAEIEHCDFLTGHDLGLCSCRKDDLRRRAAQSLEEMIESPPEPSEKLINLFRARKGGP